VVWRASRVCYCMRRLSQTQDDKKTRSSPRLHDMYIGTVQIFISVWMEGSADAWDGEACLPACLHRASASLSQHFSFLLRPSHRRRFATHHAPHHAGHDCDCAAFQDFWTPSRPIRAVIPRGCDLGASMLPPLITRSWIPEFRRWAMGASHWSVFKLSLLRSDADTTSAWAVHILLTGTLRILAPGRTSGGEGSYPFPLAAPG